MEKMDIINNFVKIFYITVISYFVYIKISNYKQNNIVKSVIIVLESLLIGFFYVVLTKYVYPIGAIVILYSIYGITMNIIVKNEVNHFIVAYILSLVITYIVYLISVIIVGTILSLFMPYINYKGFTALAVILIVASLAFYLLLKMKRIKNGFNFLSNISININIIFFTIFFGGIILVFFGLLQKTNNTIQNTGLFTGSIFIIISLMIWTQNQITKQYKRNMKDRTIEIQKKEIDEQLKIIEEVKEENLKLAKVIHKYNSRLSALELGIRNTIEQNNKTEFADELGIILGETKEISKNFSEETTITNNKLPLTNIISIDNMFKYFEKEANKKDINFNLIINESVKPLLEIIDKAKLETLIGDHLKDAIIAVNERENSYKSILAILGVSEDCYEFSVCDTGIEFEIDILLKLGLEQITTHKDAGGSGIGFMTTFETLKETKASLIIEEYNPKTTNYTKSVIIRFDGKGEYRINSYRADEIKGKSKTKRIIVEEL